MQNLDLEKKKADVKVDVDFMEGGRVYMVRVWNGETSLPHLKLTVTCFLDSAKILLQIKKPTDISRKAGQG